MPEENENGNYVPYPQVNRDNIDRMYADGERLKVRCIAPQGLYYDFNRRREGDVFYLKPYWVTLTETDKKKPSFGKPIKKDGIVQRKIITAREQFSDETMQMVDEETPEKYTDAQEALDIKTSELSDTPRRGPGRPRKEE